MPTDRDTALRQAREEKLASATEILRLLGFASRQRNDAAGHTLLALLGLQPEQSWSEATAPYCGITPIIKFISESYGVDYAPNTRETIRDEAVKHFVESGLVLRNPDDLGRPTNSGKTVYQIEPNALDLIRLFNTDQWNDRLESYCAQQETIRHEIERHRTLVRIPLALPSGESITLSPGGQNPLIQSIVEEFCPRFTPGAAILYIGDAEDKFRFLKIEYLENLGVKILAPAKMPDVVVHDVKRNWLVLIEAVSTGGPVDGKRRKELKELFAGCKAGLVFVTAFQGREAMRTFLPQISWESEVWVADDPDHLIHFDGERFLGPYPDAIPH
jgi:hypothetical protein